MNNTSRMGDEPLGSATGFQVRPPSAVSTSASSVASQPCSSDVKSREITGSSKLVTADHDCPPSAVSSRSAASSLPKATQPCSGSMKSKASSRLGGFGRWRRRPRWREPSFNGRLCFILFVRARGGRRNGRTSSSTASHDDREDRKDGNDREARAHHTWKRLEATGGFEPPIRVLQSASKRPSPSSSVHFISGRAATQPPSSANIRCHPPVLLSVLLSKSDANLSTLAQAVERRAGTRGPSSTSSASQRPFSTRR